MTYIADALKPICCCGNEMRNMGQWPRFKFNDVVTRFVCDDHKTLTKHGNLPTIISFIEPNHKVVEVPNADGSSWSIEERVAV